MLKISGRLAKGLIVGPLVVGTGIAAIWWLPNIVRERAEAAVRQRTGMEATVKAAEVGLASVVLRGVSVGAQASASITAQRVEIQGSLFGLAWNGSRSIDSVSIEHVRADLPLHKEAGRELVKRVRSRGPSAPKSDDGATGGAARRLPTIEIRDLELKTSDALGPLVSMRMPHARLGEREWTALIEDVQVGGREGTRVSLDKAELRAQAGDEGMRLKAAKLGTFEVVLPDATADPPPASTRLRARLRAALKAPEASPDTKPAEPSAGPGPLWRRLAEGCEITLKSGEVRSDGASEPVLRGLTGKVVAQGPGVVGLKGRGKARGGGSLAWDLRLRLEQLEADGRVELRALPLVLVAPLLPEIPWYASADARIDAELVIQTESVQRVRLAGEASLRDAALASPRLATTPVQDINLTVSGRGHWLPLDKRLELEEAQITLGEATGVIKGAVEWSPDHYLFNIDARLQDTPCTAAVRSIPRDLLGEMALAEWRGKIGGTLELKLDSRDFEATVMEIDISDRCEFMAVPAMADLRRFRLPFVHSVLEPDGTQFEMETGPGTPAWTYLEDISPFLVHAVLAHEDASFFTHPGFSPRHIRNALVRNLREGRYVVGASTITMQLVKNIFLHREKTLARKVQEVLLTWWIERVMDKSEILELYLNVIEYGPSVYGIRSGARHYFNRLPSQLSPAEAVYLSTILPNPKRYHSHFERGSLSSGWLDRMRKIFARMRARGWYSPEATEYGLAELGNFRFVPEGTVTEARRIPGSTALLPYMRSFDGDGEWDTLDPTGNETGLSPTPAPPGG